MKLIKKWSEEHQERIEELEQLRTTYKYLAEQHRREDDFDRAIEHMRISSEIYNEIMRVKRVAIPTGYEVIDEDV